MVTGAISETARVAVLLGGMSSEREVSLATGRAVMSALEDLGHEVIRIDAGPDLALRLDESKPEAAFIALHGKFGEDGAVQGLLECQGIPYTASGVLASAVAMDKVTSKRLFIADGLPTPPFVLHRLGEGRATPPTGYPCVVKPASEGSSVGVSIVRSEAEIDAALELAHRYDEVVLVERYIPGREIQVGMLGGEVLGTLEIVTKSDGFYDYETKYTKGLAEHLVPAPLAEDVRERIESLAARAWACLGCEGHGRVEFLLEDDRDPYLLEVNTLPGMTETSLLPEIAEAAGIDFRELVRRILSGARLHIPRVAGGKQ